MDASEMARRRWQNVTREEHSNLARAAAITRWSHATESDLSEARARAAKARGARTKKLAARLLDVDISKLMDVNVKLLPSSKFRSQKSHEQAAYWDQLREEQSVRATYPDQQRARGATIIRPAPFRIVSGNQNVNGT